MKWLSKRFTFLVLADANQSVRRYSATGLALTLAAAAAVLLALGCALFWYLFTDRSGAAKELQSRIDTLEAEYKNELAVKEELIEGLHSDLYVLSDQAKHLENKMAEITELELQLKEIAGIEEPDVRISSAASGGEAAAGGQGGEEIVLPELSDNELASETMRRFADLSKLMDELKPSLSETRQAVLEHQKLMDVTPTIWPTDSRKITSMFGTRSDPMTGRRTMHAGLDIGGDRGDPIYAAAAGTVTVSERSYPEGNYVVINHGRGLTTRYLHLNERLVEAGDRVQKGQLIGELGNTGRSTGPHLHYEVIVNGTPVNPMPYIKEDRKEP
jgi:Membrane proteins related to metalloendopeptidases